MDTQKMYRIKKDLSISGRPASVKLECKLCGNNTFDESFYLSHTDPATRGYTCCVCGNVLFFKNRLEGQNGESRTQTDIPPRD